MESNAISSPINVRWCSRSRWSPCSAYASTDPAAIYKPVARCPAETRSGARRPRPEHPELSGGECLKTAEPRRRASRRWALQGLWKQVDRYVELELAGSDVDAQHRACGVPPRLPRLRGGRDNLRALLVSHAGDKSPPQPAEVRRSLDRPDQDDASVKTPSAISRSRARRDRARPPSCTSRVQRGPAEEESIRSPLDPSISRAERILRASALTRSAERDEATHDRAVGHVGEDRRQRSAAAVVEHHESGRFEQRPVGGSA
jgi:hypothetical protein